YTTLFRSAAHRGAGLGQRVDARLPARTGGLPAGHAAPAEVLAAGGARGQRARRQERVLQLHPGGVGGGRAGGVQRARRGLTRGWRARAAVAAPPPTSP